METELKLIISDLSDLARLLQQLPVPESVVEQRNHYFVDPRGMLRRRRVMLRVREEFSVDSGALLRVIATVKRRLSRAKGVFVADEQEAVWDKRQWKDFCLRQENLAMFSHEFMVRIRRELGFDTLVKEGTTVNIRHRVPVGGFVFELDKTTFPNGVVDTEVEVETDRPEEARALLEQLADQAGIALSTQVLGKYARFKRSVGR